MTDLTYANIDLNILKENYRALKAAAGENDLICVVKADAYGHGDIPCTRALAEAGCSAFAVANISEALRVRSAAPDATVLIFGMTPPEHAPLLSKNRLTQTVYSASYAKALSEAAEDTIEVHIKLDTGMNRLGFSADDEGTAEAIAACSLPKLSVRGIYSHLACADDPTSLMTERQIALFRRAAESIGEHCTAPLILHIGNSAALRRNPDCAEADGKFRTALRAGILLYGLDPSDTVRAEGITEPVMELYSTVTHVHTAKAGETVGYGAAYNAQRHTEVATVAIGYADGFLRAYGRGGAAALTKQNSMTAPIIGRVCMDQLMLDVTDIRPAVKPGDTVRLFGRGAITADDIAKRADTIGYEVVCAVSARVPRRYI